MSLLGVGERTRLLRRAERGYGAQRVIRRDVANDQNKAANEYFATIDKLVKENTKNAEKVTQDILKILPE